MRLYFISLLALFIFLTISCSKRTQQIYTIPLEQDTLRYPLSVNPLSYDPAFVQDNDTFDLMQQIYENLVSLSDHEEVRPRLAESWAVSDNGLLYTFKLKEGIKFHHGREVTATDVKWSLDRATHPKLASPTVSNYLSDIEGATERLQGFAPEISGVQIIDKYTLSIKLKQFCPYFLGKLTHPVAAVLPREKVPETRPMTHIRQMVGTGPFKVVEHIPHQLVVLEAFADYHEGAPQINKIVRPIIFDSITRVNKYKSGDIDLVTVDRRALYALEKDPRWSGHLRFYRRPAIHYLALNQSKFEPFKDLRVRKAFAMALDRNKIVHVILGGIHEIANSIIPWCVPGYRPDISELPFDPERAKQLLREAGYDLEKDFRKLEFYVRGDQPDAKIMGEAVVTQLSRNLGIRIKLTPLDPASFFEKRSAGRMAFYCNCWAADYLDPHNFLSLMLTTHASENKVGYSNSEFDRLCHQADEERDPLKRIELYREAEDIVLKEVPWIPIYFSREIELVNPRLSGLRPTPFGHLAHSQVILKK